MERVRALKAALGRKPLILTHHYQRDEIVALGDYPGDSFHPFYPLGSGNLCYGAGITIFPRSGLPSVA